MGLISVQAKRSGRALTFAGIRMITFDLLCLKTACPKSTIVVLLWLFIVLFCTVATHQFLGFPGQFNSLLQSIVLQGKGRGWGFMVLNECHYTAEKEYPDQRRKIIFWTWASYNKWLLLLTQVLFEKVDCWAGNGTEQNSELASIGTQKNNRIYVLSLINLYCSKNFN